MPALVRGALALLRPPRQARVAPSKTTRGGKPALGRGKRWSGWVPGLAALLLLTPAAAQKTDDELLDPQDAGGAAEEADEHGAEQANEQPTTGGHADCCCCDAPCGSAGRAAKDLPSQRVSLTFSPLHLFYPVIELTAEARAAPRLGLGLTVGTGRMTTNTTDAATGQDRTVAATAQEWGGSAAYYPIKPFRSLQLGAEIMYLRIEAEELNAAAAETADGFAIGPFIGYKLLTKVGFTAVAQIGGQYVNARSEERDSAGGVVEKAGTSWAPLLNLNVGWSF